MTAPFSMRSVGTVLLLVATCTATVQNTVTNEENPSEVAEAFYTYFLVPYATNSVPPKKLSVRFSLEIVNLGNKIPAYSASAPPYIYYEAAPDELYAVFMVDVDYPSTLAPINSQYLLALLLNIPGNDIAKANYLTPYTPVSPFPGSGYHRYVIYLYKQNKKIDINCAELQNISTNLTNFCVEEFSARYELELVAGNFFLAGNIVCDNELDDAPTQCSL